MAQTGFLITYTQQNSIHWGDVRKTGARLFNVKGQFQKLKAIRDMCSVFHRNR
jgi:hypothetical protein